jgi:hypothetical protein
MGLFYKASDKELLDLRNKVFMESGIPALQKNGFRRSPYSTAWFGRNNLKDFTYELCRLNDRSQLEIITVHISRGDRWIKVYLNIFALTPGVESLDQLNGMDGLQFEIPPNSRTQMQLRMDDFKGMPLFHTIKHKIRSYYSRKGLGKRIHALGKLIEKDLGNIDSFVGSWHSMHKPAVTTWEGHVTTGQKVS